MTLNKINKKKKKVYNTFISFALEKQKYHLILIKFNKPLSIRTKKINPNPLFT